MWPRGAAGVCLVASGAAACDRDPDLGGGAAGAPDRGAPDTGAPDNGGAAGCDGGAAGRGDGAAGASCRGWCRRAPLARGPRQETAVVAAGGEVWVLGGFDDSLGVVATVEVYHPATDTWRDGPSLPEPLHHANAAAVDDTLYVVGALRGLSFSAAGEVWALPPGAGEWSARSPMPEGSERGAAAVGVIGARVYLAGGFRARAVADCSAYDTGTDTHERLPDLPEPRDHLAGAAVGGVLFAIGGRRAGLTDLRDRVDAFDPASGAWSARAPMPTARAGIAAGVAGGRILVVGGEGNRAAPTGVFDDAEAYDPAADAWEVLDPMPTPRHGTGAAGAGDTLYVPGGADVQAFGAVATHESYTP